MTLFYSFKTIDRNRDWVSNEVLFLEDVKISRNSAKAHDDAGGILFNKANEENNKDAKKQLLIEALAHFDTALTIHPNNMHASMHKAATFHLSQDYTKSIAQYRHNLTLWPQDPKIKKALALSLRENGSYLASKMNDLTSAQKFLTESLTYNNQDPVTSWLMGVSFAKQNQFNLAQEWFTKTLALDPNNASYLYDLGTTYFKLGDTAKGTEYYKKVEAINPAMIKNRAKK